MQSISKFFIENYKFSIVLTIFVILFGLGGMVSLTSESFPTVNIGQVIIKTVYPGASAEDIETKITKPIEDEIRSVTGIDEVRSISQPGLSTIFTVVDVDNYPVEEVVSDLQRAVDRVSGLPTDLENPPSFIEIKTEEFPVIELAIIGEAKLRDKVAIELAESLEDNRKISGIIKTGFRERQFNIYLDPKKLDRYHVGLDEVLANISSQNLTIPGGSLESKSDKSLIKIDGKRRTNEEIASIVLRSTFSGSQVLLGDVAEIRDTQEDALRLARYEGRSSTNLTISKKSGADLIVLAEEVKKELEKFSKKYEGSLEFYIFNNEGKRVAARLDVLSSNAIFGLILVIFFLIIFLPGRAGLMAAFSLPLATLATFAMMQVNDMSFNTITILAMVISIGMLVDNSVVVSENYQRLLNEGYTSKEAVLKSVRDLWLPISATAFTTIAAFLPMLVTKGIVGQFIRGIPIVVSAALLISLFESFILLPVRLVRSKDAESNVRKDLYRTTSEEELNTELEHAKQQKDWFSRLVLPPFTRFVDFLIRYRYFTALVFTGIIFGSLYMMAVKNKFILFPANQTEIYIARAELEKGSPIEKTDQAMAELSTKVRELFGDAIAHMVSGSGASESQPNDPKAKSGDNVAMLRIFMTDEGKNALSTNEVLSRLRGIQMEEMARLSFEAIAQGPPSGDPVTGILRSNDSKQLESMSVALQEKLESTPGLVDVRIDNVFGEDEIYVNVDTKKASRLGVDMNALGRSVRVAMAGQSVSDVNLDNREVKFFVRFNDASREDIEQLENLKLMNNRGDLIALKTIASFNKESGAAHIKRFDFKPAKTLTANVNDEIITSVEANAKLSEYFAELSPSFPDVSLQFSGEGERIKESMTSLASALILSVIGIFALLVFLFKSYVKPLIILTTVPLGLLGVAVAFNLHDKPISFLALIGVVGLSGIIVNSGIVLISFIDQMKHDTHLSLKEILTRSTTLRLRAVIVTSLTTVSGLMPTSYGIGGSDQFIIPMTLAMAWGLVSGTILALIWVPCAYAIVEDIASLKERVFSRKTSAQRAVTSDG